ncbi:MAG: FAD binding domain-containing protein, partial [Actinomycetota bacterium]
MAEFTAPRTIDHLAIALSIATSASRLVAGGTDLVPALRRGLFGNVDLLIDLSHLDELSAIRRTIDGRVSVGAGATFARLTSDAMVVAHAPLLARVAAGVGSSQIRNVATLGGNVANASPCGDGTLALVALGAEAVIIDGSGETRRCSVAGLLVGPGR